jgi:GR25 family glycosyltransferase involved in LPS biosynthesis
MKIDIREIPTYYINLDDHVEKRKSTEKVLDSLGFKDVTRVPGVLNANSRLGCTLAHSKALETALESSKGPFLVLEDDILVRNKSTVFDVPDTADALYLGISRWGLYNGKGHRQISVEKHDDSIYRLYNMLSGHAILYFNEDYAKLLLKSYKFYELTSDVQDKANAELMKYYEVYGLTNPVFYQEGINEKETNFALPGPKAFDKFHSMLLK